MRISLFTRGANPRLDKPIARKSEFYIAELIRQKCACMLPTDAYRMPAAMLLVVRDKYESREHKLEHGTFSDAWGTQQSGYAGPLVMQMRRTDVRIQVPA